MSFRIVRAAVVDDAFGAPVAGSVDSDDKNLWLDFLIANDAVQIAVIEEFIELSVSDIGELFEAVTSQQRLIEHLWVLSRKAIGRELGLDILFKTERLNRMGKIEKAELVTQILQDLIGSASDVEQFSNLRAAAGFLTTADVAFIDFFFNDSESEEQALTRIKKYSSELASVKLVFFMSSRASLETQQKVRDILQVRTAFFEVMKKSQIDDEYVRTRVLSKVQSYDSNFALQSVIKALMTAASEAANEFDQQSKTLEVHDLQFLDFFRLNAESQTLTEYLTWLFSEALAAKTRRLGLPVVAEIAIDSGVAGFTGEILQRQVLFDFFSEVVFSPPASKGIRFGDVIISDKNKYYLVISPACDLVRCSLEKNVLCVEASVYDYSDPRMQSKEKLFGKHVSGLRHLFKPGSKKPECALLFIWQKDSVQTFKYADLCGRTFRRVAFMNEIFAHEVKEEVLRELGRVGTSINPSPPFALHACIRWWHGREACCEVTPSEDFISALLTYSEQKTGEKSRSAPTVVLSDRFKDWASRMIYGKNGAKIEGKLKACVDFLSLHQFQLNDNWCYKNNELLMTVSSAEPLEPLSQKTLLEITLIADFK
ncbi:MULTISPECIES: hypothetical protein [Pseudomonas syringae group]|uniref:Uncharacterized protein n=3 Tax=Pseudomonas syringae group TaxID=136849 RepID=F3GAV1_PSESJ|nr:MULTISPECIES: hypothetical protein [Pseudomonas syringae group]EGH44201.1 hypothetical protein PSYPI_18121 [Pseudomonas syringae pv. pisi str. 1704B]RMU72089.1 hypothetical protein ALP24_00288 [Pseudomonas syringae pv. aptata]PYD18159.1 hypothetical protein DND62_01940 [Pseudomonas syringae pv. pisi]PYD32952.1 hypothetical protein DND58_06205 [Pseudomonas syringae pv. pisi]RML53124.1 hypothetical protein ALQ93_00167 [Pseudomonas syringae pv. pisi]